MSPRFGRRASGDGRRRRCRQAQYFAGAARRHRHHRVLGAHIHQISAGYWPTAEGEADCQAINATPKPVCRSTIDPPPVPVRVIEGDVVAELLGPLAARRRRMIVGQPDVCRPRCSRGAADQLWLRVCPMLVGDHGSVTGTPAGVTVAESTIVRRGVVEVRCRLGEPAARAEPAQGAAVAVDQRSSGRLRDRAQQLWIRRRPQKCCEVLVILLFALGLPATADTSTTTRCSSARTSMSWLCSDVDWLHLITLPPTDAARWSNASSVRATVAKMLISSPRRSSARPGTEPLAANRRQLHSLSLQLERAAGEVGIVEVARYSVSARLEQLAEIAEIACVGASSAASKEMIWLTILLDADLIACVCLAGKPRPEALAGAGRFVPGAFDHHDTVVGHAASLNAGWSTCPLQSPAVDRGLAVRWRAITSPESASTIS